MQTIDKVRSALRRLSLSDNEQNVYLSLLTDGQATARTLASRTGITRPSVYDQLKSLRAHNLVIELEFENKTYFAAADVKYLQALLEDKIDRLEQSRDFLIDALPSLRDSLTTVDPKVRFFTGTEGVKQLLKDIMWHDNTTLSMIWPEAAMQEVFDPLFLAWFDERRIKRSLAVRSIWTQRIAKHTASLFCGYPNDQQKQLATADLTMATIIYDNKVSYISSGTEAFGFITESTEFSALQKLQFETLWKQAAKRTR